MGSRWESLYAAKQTPWETQQPATQLVEYTRRHSVEGLRAVELCCGTGASAVHLAQAGCSLVVGVDIAPAAVAAARERAREAGVEERCLFLCADALSAPPGELLREARRFEQQRAARLKQTSKPVRSLSGRFSEAVLGSTSEPSSPVSQSSRSLEEDVAVETEEDEPFRFDFAFDCQGFQLLWAVDAEQAALTLAALLRPAARLMTVAGNANEYRAYEGGGTSLTCAELVGALCPPTFALISLKETRFDAGECDAVFPVDCDGEETARPSTTSEGSEDWGERCPPLAWCAVLERGADDKTVCAKLGARPPSFGSMSNCSSRATLSDGTHKDHARSSFATEKTPRFAGNPSESNNKSDVSFVREALQGPPQPARRSSYSRFGSKKPAVAARRLGSIRSVTTYRSSNSAV